MLSQNLRRLVDATPAVVSASLERTGGADCVALLQEVNYGQWQEGDAAGEGVPLDPAVTHRQWRPWSIRVQVGNAHTRVDPLISHNATSNHSQPLASSSSSPHNNLLLNSKVAILFPARFAPEMGDRGPARMQDEVDQFYA